MQQKLAEVVPLASDENRIRIAFSIDNMQLGGTELNAVRTAERLDRSRFDLRVISLQEKGPLLERYARAGVPVHFFPLGSLCGSAALTQGIRLARFLGAAKIDVLHAHDVYSNVFSVAWARLAGVRTIASRRWWEGLPGPAWRWADRLGYSLADLAVANAPRVAARLRQEYGLGPNRVAVVPNFLDESAFRTPGGAELRALREEFGLSDSDRVIGMVANLNPVKDHANLLRAAALLLPRWPRLRLVLVGEGPERPRLHELAGRLGIGERVVLAGSRSNDPNLHHLFEVSVLCSRSEGLPNSVLEAMAAGRPVVATDVGAMGDAVSHEEGGLLLPPGDPARLAAAIDSLLLDPERARRMGAAGRRRARSAFSETAALAALEGLYSRLAGACPHPALAPG